MTKEVSIIDLVKIIRSKNAGPFEVTFDIIFKDKETYEKVKKTKVITKELIAKLYHISIEKVLYFVEFDPANAIKGNHCKTGGFGKHRGDRCLWCSTTRPSFRYQNTF